MLIQHEFAAYNTRRYSKPWAARITFQGTKPVYNFTGIYDHGTLAFDADPGDIIAMGQRDMRGNGTSNDWYAVTETDLSYLKGGRVEALQLYRERIAAEGAAMLAAREAMEVDPVVELRRVQAINAKLVAALEAIARDGGGAAERLARETLAEMQGEPA